MATIPIVLVVNRKEMNSDNIAKFFSLKVIDVIIKSIIDSNLKIRKVILDVDSEPIDELENIFEDQKKLECWMLIYIDGGENEKMIFQDNFWTSGQVSIEFPYNVFHDIIFKNNPNYKLVREEMGCIENQPHPLIQRTSYVTYNTLHDALDSISQVRSFIAQKMISYTSK